MKGEGKQAAGGLTGRGFLTGNWARLALAVAAGLILALLAATVASGFGVTMRASTDSAGNEANGLSEDAAASADGRYLAFYSYASNLVPGDTNGMPDVFVKDTQSGAITRVSTDSAGNQGNYGSGLKPTISADGRYVAFYSASYNLVAGDTNASGDIFVKDRQTGIITRISTDSAGAQGNDISWNPAISADGRHVAFTSNASNLVPGDTNGYTDIYVKDRQTGATTRVSTDSFSNQGNDSSGGYPGSNSPAISNDGRYVAFSSRASNLVPGDMNICTGFSGNYNCYDVFVKDRQTGITNRVSNDSNGTAGNGDSVDPAISADGRYVAYTSNSSNLVPGDTNAARDIFVKDRQSYVTSLVSADMNLAGGNGASDRASISADGRYVAFDSAANNLLLGFNNQPAPLDNNLAADVFVKDRQTGDVIRSSTDGSGYEGNADSLGASIAADGRHSGFTSWASNLVGSDLNGVRDVFVAEAPITCTAGEPALAIQNTSVYWASYADYTAGLLSIDFSVNNNGAAAAYIVQITGATATNGVTCATCQSPVTVSLGNLVSGAGHAFTLKYNIPIGVTSFSTLVNASAQDGCGTGYTYP